MDGRTLISTMNAIALSQLPPPAAVAALKADLTAALAIALS